jgi:CRP-like cAMP-binding protein
MDATQHSTPLVRKLESILVLSEDEKDVLRNVSGTIKTVGPRQDLVREGDRPFECCLILEGFAYRYKQTEDGKRQIFSFHIPGDIPDLQSLHLDVMDHSLSSLPACHGNVHSARGHSRPDPALSAHWRRVLARHLD